MNQNKPKDFDQDIREKLEGYRPEVPAGLWDSIQTELDQRMPVTPSAEQVNTIAPPSTSGIKRINWANWSIAAAVLVFVSVALLYNRDQDTLYLRNDMPLQVTEAPTSAVLDKAAIADTELEDAKEGLKELNRLLGRMVEPREQKAHLAEMQHVVIQEIHQQNTLHEPAPNPLTLQETQVVQSDLTLLATADLKPQLQQAEMVEQPLIVEQATQPSIAHDQDKKEGFGVSRILNLVVAQVDKRSEKFVSFSDDEEGNLKIDFNLAQHRNTNRNINK